LEKIMPDTVAATVVVLEVDAGSGETAYVTNAGYDFSHDSKSYINSQAMKLAPFSLTGDMGTEEYKIQKLDATIGVLARLSVNVPYPQCSVVIKELTLDADLNVTGESFLFTGQVYNVEVRPLAGLMDIIARDYKYYLDRTAGVVCTEQCDVGFFGDTFCQATTQAEDHVIAEIAGFNITLATDPILTTPFLFNKGIAEIGGSKIAIRYHESGRVFELSRPVPSYWLGQTVTINTGCDRRLETCRDIHNNEDRFLGLGYSMVDYNPLYENP
jgi:hypothetical protein